MASTGAKRPFMAPIVPEMLDGAPDDVEVQALWSSSGSRR